MQIQIPELLSQIRTTGPVDPQIEHLNKVVKLLWSEVEQLRRFISVANNQVVVKIGESSIVLKPNGSIDVKGREITVAGSGRVAVKASGELVLKGSKIQQN